MQTISFHLHHDNLTCIIFRQTVTTDFCLCTVSINVVGDKNIAKTAACRRWKKSTCPYNDSMCATYVISIFPLQNELTLFHEKFQQRCSLRASVPYWIIYNRFTVGTVVSGYSRNKYCLLQDCIYRNNVIFFHHKKKYLLYCTFNCIIDIRYVILFLLTLCSLYITLALPFAETVGNMICTILVSVQTRQKYFYHDIRNILFFTTNDINNTLFV